MSDQQLERPRLDIFDGIRGHLLIGMLIAHLSFQSGLGWLINIHHKRFILIYDAEFFVLIAGLLVGYLWTTTYKTNVLRRKFVVNRLSTIYKYYVISALPFFLYAVSNGVPFLDGAFGILVMQLGGWYSDILPIYFVCFLLIAPFAVFPTLNRPVLMFIFSLLIYFASQVTDLRGFFGSSGEFVVFDIAAWQFLFVCAILIGHRCMYLFEALRQVDARIVGFVLILIVSVSLLLRLNSYYPNPIAPYETLVGNAPRMGLHPIFLMRIFLISASISIILIRNDIWFRPINRILHWYFGLSLVRNVGKYSIQMFVIHVYILALYKVYFIEAAANVKTMFAIFWIVSFIAVPNLWVRLKAHGTN